MVSLKTPQGRDRRDDARLELERAPLARGRQPADADDLFKLLGVIHDHLLVVVVEDDLLKVAAALALEEFRVALKERQEEVVELIDRVAVSLPTRNTTP